MSKSKFLHIVEYEYFEQYMFCGFAGFLLTAKKPCPKQLSHNNITIKKDTLQKNEIVITSKAYSLTF